MAAITLEGNLFNTCGDLPEVGSAAPDFVLTAGDLSDTSLDSYDGKKKLISIVPSLDTGVCAMSTQKFEQEVANRDDMVALLVSADLPFAQGRFCGDNDIANMVTLSLMHDTRFATDYGMLIVDGPLRGVTGRAIVVLDADNKVVYTQLVGEIVDEPDYEAAMGALDAC